MKSLSLKSFLGLTALMSAVGCSSGGGGSFSILPDTESFIQTNSSFSNKIDILFVIADEPSMSSHQQNLVNSFATFFQQFAAKGYDFKIAVVTSAAYMADPTLNGYDSADANEDDFNDCSGATCSNTPIILPDDPNLFANFAINAKPTKNSSGQDGRAFSSFRQALREDSPVNAGFRRADAFLAVVIVSNSEDFSGNGRCVGCNNSGRYNAPTLDSVQVYVDYLNQLTNSSGATARYNVSAMTQSSSPCQGSSLMTRIMALADATNGVVGDICQSDYGSSMAEIAGQIATLSTQFILDRKPVVSTIRVSVDGVSVPEDSINGWGYDAEANAVRFYGSAVPAVGSVILVDFDPAELDLD